jgi:8-oxo-dGTP pyrophosphatase MutT (NUDIX family)
MEKTISSKIVFTCPIFKVEETEVELPNGRRENRWYVLKKDAVGVIALDSDGKILLTKEYRSAAADVCWRIPAGGVKEGESPEDAARREMREEIGLDCKNLTMLLEAKSQSASIKQKSYFYLAKNLISSPLESGEWEHIEVVRKRPDEVIELIHKGEISGNIAVALLKAIDLIRLSLG